MYVWIVSIVIQGILITEVGPYTDYSVCQEMKNVIENDIDRAYKINHPDGYDGSKWGLSDSVHQSDYAITCDLRR
jgi:hypothetical protein